LYRIKGELTLATSSVQSLARIIHERRENGRKWYKITRCEP
jgi:hypothetical protein